MGEKQEQERGQGEPWKKDGVRVTILSRGIGQVLTVTKIP